MPAKKTKKRNPRSEAAMREAVKLLTTSKLRLLWDFDETPNEVHAVDTAGESVAIFDVRDCYRKRKPLKGIGKKLAKVVRTGR